MVRITFYADEACLGTYDDCPYGSSQEERNAIARKHGINHYTKFILDNGRIIGWVEDGQLMHHEYGEDGINQLNTNTMNQQDNFAYPNAVSDTLNEPTPQTRRGTGEPQSLNQGNYRGPLAPDECVKRNKAREVRITQIDYGYIVKVGCQTLVFENMDTLIEKLTAYLKDPNAVEKKWMTEGIL